MTQIPKKLDAHSPHYQMINTINQLIDYLHELTSRIDTIAGNQLEMKRGKRCPEEDFGFEPINLTDAVSITDQPKRWRAEKRQTFWYVTQWGDVVESREWNTEETDFRYAIGNYFFNKADAEAYKAKLLADNAQV